MIHRQYRTNEAIHISFLLESGSRKMSRTVFDDCKPWFVKPGKVDTCLCKVCEDFRLVKKAATYNYELLQRPYHNLRILGRFLFAACTTLKMMRRKYGEYRLYEKNAVEKRMLTLLFGCVRQVEAAYRRPLCVYEFCCTGMVGVTVHSTTHQRETSTCILHPASPSSSIQRVTFLTKYSNCFCSTDTRGAAQHLSDDSFVPRAIFIVVVPL